MLKSVVLIEWETYRKKTFRKRTFRIRTFGLMDIWHNENLCLHWNAICSCMELLYATLFMLNVFICNGTTPYKLFQNFRIFPGIMSEQILDFRTFPWIDPWEMKHRQYFWKKNPRRMMDLIRLQIKKKNLLKSDISNIFRRIFRAW